MRSCSSSSPAGRRGRSSELGRALPAALLAAAVISAPSKSFAEPPALHGDALQSAAIALAVAGAVGVTELILKPRLAPSPARWPDRDPNGADTLNALDRSASRLRWESEATARRLSDIGLLVSSLSALSMSAVTARLEGERLSEFALDAAIITESTAVAMAINQATKFIAGRERPCKHFEPSWSSRPLPGSPGSVGPCGADRFDENLSSFSGHTTLVASSWAASGTVAVLRGNPLAPLLFGTGAIFTLATGYLRIAAGKHYLSDVLVGAVLGSAVGFLVPFTFHGRTSTFEATRSGPAASGSAPSRALGGRAAERAFRFSFVF
jgi:hypothetical protein